MSGKSKSVPSPKVTTGDLARMVQGGFERQDKRLESVDMSLEGLEYGQQQTNKHIDAIERDIAAIKPFFGAFSLAHVSSA